MKARICWLDRDIRYFMDVISEFIESDYYSEKDFTYDFFQDEEYVEDLPTPYPEPKLDLSSSEEKVLLVVSQRCNIKAHLMRRAIFISLSLSAPNGDEYEIDINNVSSMFEIIQRLQEDCKDGMFEGTCNFYPINHSLKESNDSRDSYVFWKIVQFTDKLVQLAEEMS